MNKPTESSTNTEMGNNTPASQSTKPSTSREILEFMKESEAREWIERFNTKKSQVGLQAAKLWWSRNILEIERIRGKKAADDLRTRMNRIQNVNRDV